MPFSTQQGFHSRSPAWRAEHRPRPREGRGRRTLIDPLAPLRSSKARPAAAAAKPYTASCPRLPLPGEATSSPLPTAPPFTAAAATAAAQGGNDSQPQQRAPRLRADGTKNRSAPWALSPGGRPAALPRFAGSDLRLSGSRSGGFAAMAARDIKAVVKGSARRRRCLNRPPYSASLIGPAAGLELANGGRAVRYRLCLARRPGRQGSRGGGRWVGGAGRARRARGAPCRCGKMAAAPRAAARGRGAGGDGACSPGGGRGAAAAAWSAGGGGEGGEGVARPPWTGSRGPAGCWSWGRRWWCSSAACGSATGRRR